MKRALLLGLAVAATAGATGVRDPKLFDELTMTGPDRVISLKTAKAEHDAEVKAGLYYGLDQLPAQADEAASALPGAPLPDESGATHSTATPVVDLSVLKGLDLNVNSQLQRAEEKEGMYGMPGHGEQETGLLPDVPTLDVNTMMIVKDHSRPTLVLNGGRIHHFQVENKAWQDPGAKCYAFDKNKGSIEHIRTYADRSGAVDLSKPGLYKVHYACTDKSGVQSEPITRSVVVHARSSPLDNAPAFKVDCVMELWDTWTPCTHACGNQGVHQRTRTIEVYPTKNGAKCGPTTEMRPCNVFGCPVDCKMGLWGAWSECSRSCGKGVRKRAKAVLTQPQYGGRPCPPEMWTAEYHICHGAPCASDCDVSDWTAWTACSKTCGGEGQQTRYRVITATAFMGGKACPSLLANRPCKADGCPVDCVISPWGAWGACSATCGVGRQTRARTQLVAAAHGGKACPLTSVQSQLCHEHDCQDCKVSQWTPMYECSKTCGGGIQVYRRIIVKGAVMNGAACPGLLRQEACNTAACPVDCVVAPFGMWSKCTTACGGGSSKRTRTVVAEAQFGGRKCPHLAMTKQCNNHACPKPCQVAAWSKWSTKCSRSCGSGVIFRKRQVQVPPELGGKPCPALVDYLHCNTKACPEDCEVGKWGDFSPCTKSCAGGHTTRTRKLLRAPQLNGDACPSLIEVRDCNKHACGASRCHDSHAHCYINQAHRLVVTHSKELWHLGGKFKCELKHGSKANFARMYQGCECKCDRHQGCCYQENMALHNPAIPGNVLDEKLVISPDDCCHQCTMHPECGSWEFTTRGTHGSPLLPRIELVEGKVLEFEETLNQHYLDAGARCHDGELDISRKVTTTGDAVLLSKAGIYTVTYHCTNDEGATAPSLTRTVTVTPRKGPQLIINGGVSLVFILSKTQNFVDPGARCISGVGKELPIKHTGMFVHRDVAGTTAIGYECTDPDTKQLVKEVRMVTVVPEAFGIPDQLRPQLSLKGPEIESIDESRVAKWTDAGAACLAHGTDRPLKWVRSGDTPNLAKPGIYNIKYDCKDTEGVPAKTHTRVVHVLPKLRPQLSISSGYLEQFSRSPTQKYMPPTVTCSARNGKDISSAIKRTGDTVQLDVVGDYVQRFDCQDDKGTSALTLVHRVVVTPNTVAPRVGRAICALKRGEPVYIKVPASERKGDSVAYAGPRAPETIAESTRQAQEFCPKGSSKVTKASAETELVR